MKEPNEQTLKAFAEVENMTDEERAKYPSADALFKSLEFSSQAVDCIKYFFDEKGKLRRL